MFRRCVPLDFLYGGIDRIPNADKIIPIVQRKRAPKNNEPVVVSKYIAHTEKTGIIDIERNDSINFIFICYVYSKGTTEGTYPR